MQQDELDDERQKQANLTALAAIDPRKQIKLDNEQVCNKLFVFNEDASNLDVGYKT